MDSSTVIIIVSVLSALFLLLICFLCFIDGWAPSTELAFLSAEEAILRLARTQYDKKSVELQTSDGRTCKINTLIIRSAEVVINMDQASEPIKPSPKRSPIVLLHGFAGALGFWFKNLQAIHAANPDRDLIAIDLLGFGRSSRPDVEHLQSAEQGEQWWIDSIERWRQAMNIDHMLLIGHSFGGFLAANYSIAFPHRVAGLILASPVGVPHADPNSAQVRADRIEQSSSCMRGCLYRLIYKMLERSMAPQSIIRCCGPCGAATTRRVIGFRFTYLDDIDRDALGSYLYHTTVNLASGERLFVRMFDLFGSPFVVAKRPLIDKLEALRGDVLVLYGDDDWMDRRAISEYCQSPHSSQTVQLQIVPQCGHQMYVENPDAFNRIVNQFCQQVHSAPAL